MIALYSVCKKVTHGDSFGLEIALLRGFEAHQMFVFNVEGDMVPNPRIPSVITKWRRDGCHSHAE